MPLMTKADMPPESMSRYTPRPALCRNSDCTWSGLPDFYHNVSMVTDSVEYIIEQK